MSAPFERHVFVCLNERPAGHPRGCCAARGSVPLHLRLKQLVRERGLHDRVRINQAGCLDLCENGATLVVYPEGAWYGAVTAEDAEEIVERHLVGGEPVTRLLIPPDRYRRHP
jgi:(2Fe-2S) ferredoxin